MEYACVKNGIVENVIVCDHAFADYIANKWDAVVPSQGSGIGWTYADGVFSAPEESQQMVARSGDGGGPLEPV